MRVWTRAARRRGRLLALAAGAIPLSLCSSASATPDLASDLTLEVNIDTGDVYVQASAATAFTGYDIFDKSGNLLDSGDPNTDLNERLLSQPSTTTLGNTTTYRNSTNYKFWATILDNTSTLAEGSNNGKLKQGTASTYDTINIPASGTIDFGDIYNTRVNNADLQFSFSEADPTNGGNPVTGTTYNGTVNYTGELDQPVYWKNSVTSGNWSSTTAWSFDSPNGTDSGATPGGNNDQVYISNNDALGHVISLDENSTILSHVSIGSTGGGMDTLLQTAPFNLATEEEDVGYSGQAGNVAAAGAHIQSAGANTYGSLIVGYNANSSGTYSLSGTGSIVVGEGTLVVGGGQYHLNGGAIIVGEAGTGTFNQSAGTVTVANGSSVTSELDLGSTSTGRGAYFLSGGSLTDAGGVYVGGASGGAEGIGTFAVSGGTMSVTGGIMVYSGSNFTQSGGAVSAGSMTISSGGTLGLGGGTLTAPLTIGGTLAISASQNPINLAGSLTLQSTATTLAQRVGSATTFGTVQDNGNMSLAGVLAVYEDAANEATTTSGQSFIILETTSAGVLSGVFSNIASGQTLITTDGTASFLVTINSGVDGDVVLSDFQAVPEPGMLGVLGLGGIMLMRRRRVR